MTTLSGWSVSSIADRTLDWIESLLGKERAGNAGPTLRLDMESLRSKY